MALIDTLAGVAIGAWTGYITNDIALRMIFRSYGIGRLRFGGVIPRTRGSFIESLASLAEDELLQGDALRGSIESDAFRDAAARLFSVAAERALAGLPQGQGQGQAGEAAAAEDAAAGPEDVAEPKDAAAGQGQGQAGEADAAPAEGAAGQAASRALEATSRALDRLARTLCREMPDALGGAAEALAIEAAGAMGPELSRFLDGVAERLRGDAALAGAWRRYAEQNQYLPAKRFIGERYFGTVGKNLSQAARLAGSILENELYGEASSRLAAAALLVFDVRVADRFFGELDGMSLEGALGLDIQGLAEYLAGCASGGGTGGGADGGAGGGTGGGANGTLRGLALDLSRNPALEGITLGDAVKGDGRLAAKSLTGACDEASAAAGAFFARHAEEIGRMAERSLAKAAESEAAKRGGALGFARRALIQDAGGRYRVASRLSEFVSSKIASLKTLEGAQGAIDMLLGAKLADALRAFAGSGGGSGGIGGDGGKGDDGKGDSGSGVGGSGAAAASTGNQDAWVAGMLPGLLQAAAEAQPSSIYARRTASQKADACLFIAQAAGKAAQAAALKPGAAQAALEGFAASRWEAFGEGAAARIIADAAGRISEPGAASHIMQRAVLRGGADGAIKRWAASALAGKASGSEPVASGRASRAAFGAALGAARKAMSSPRGKKAFDGLSGQASRLLAGRIGTLIQGNAKAAIKKRLDSFDDDALQRLARQFFGSLKHIMALGAVLGAAAGLLSIALETASASAASFLAGAAPAGAASAASAAFAVAARVALFAAIGWGTNIVAVEMLFQPKRAVSLFGLRIRSVVSMNKSRLADAIGKFVDDSLLDPEAARHLALLGGAQLRGTIVEAADAHAGPAAMSALAKNGPGIAKWLDGKARAIARKNAAPAAQAAVGWLGRALARIAGGRGRYGGAAGHAGSAPSLSDVAASHAGSAPGPAALVGMLRASRGDALGAVFGSPEETEGAAEALARKALRGMDAIELRSFARRMAARGYDGWLARHADAPLLPPPADVSGALEALAQNGAFLPALRGVIAQRQGQWRRSLPRALADALAAEQWRGAAEPNGGDGAGDAFWLGWLCDKAAANEGAIANALKGAIGRSLGFLPGIAWRAVDGDALIGAAVPIFLREEAPAFLRRHMGDADGILRGAAVGALRAAASGVFELDAGALTDVASKALGDAACRDSICSFAARSICRSLAGAKVGPALKALGADSAQSLARRCDGLLRAASEAVAENIRIEADDIAREAGGLAGSMAAALGGRLAFSRLLDAGPSADAADAAGEIVDSLSELSGSVGIGRAVAEAAAGSLAENRESLADAAAVWLRGGIGFDLRGLAEAALACVADNIEEIAGVQPAATDDVGEIAGVPPVSAEDGGASSPSIWRAYAELASDIGFAALADEMPALVGALDLKRVARQKVEAMDEQKIESMFKSFAGRYLRRIKAYGLWGGLFGAHPAVAAATAIAAFAASAKNSVQTALSSRRRHRD